MSIKVTTAVWEHSQFKGERLLVLLALADWSSDAGVCFPSISSIAAKSRISERSASKIMSEFRQAEVLEVLVEGGGRGNIPTYRLKGERCAGFEFLKGELQRTERVNATTRKGAPERIAIMKNHHEPSEEQSERLFDDVTSTTVSKRENEIVEKIIEIYPLSRRAGRGGRIAIKKALRRDMKSVEGANDLERLRAAAVPMYRGLQRMLAVWKREQTEQQYIPMCTTFFNQARYEIEQTQVVGAISEVSNETGESKSVTEVRGEWERERANRKPLSDKTRALFSSEASS